MDFANAVTLQGFLIPAISSRKAETEGGVARRREFRDAGLIDNRVIRSLSKVWGLGDIPILGQLFAAAPLRKSSDELARRRDAAVSSSRLRLTIRRGCRIAFAIRKDARDAAQEALAKLCIKIRQFAASRSSRPGWHR